MSKNFPAMKEMIFSEIQVRLKDLIIIKEKEYSAGILRITAMCFYFSGHLALQDNTLSQLYLLKIIKYFHVYPFTYQKA
jgi:hypothetical protein